MHIREDIQDEYRDACGEKQRIEESSSIGLVEIGQQVGGDQGKEENDVGDDESRSLYKGKKVKERERERRINCLE